jgi:hypothetical protein
MLHPQILLDEIHSGGLEVILIGVIVVTVQAVHNVTLKVIKQVHFLREFFWSILGAVVLTDIHSSMPPWGNVVKVAATASERTQTV